MEHEFIDPSKLEEMFSNYFDEKFGETGFFNKKMKEWIDKNKSKSNKDQKFENE